MIVKMKRASGIEHTCDLLALLEGEEVFPPMAPYWTVAIDQRATSSFVVTEQDLGCVQKVRSTSLPAIGIIRPNNFLAKRARPDVLTSCSSFVAMLFAVWFSGIPMTF